MYKNKYNGAQNLIDCSINNNVKKVIALSTDKASNPEICMEQQASFR